MQRNILGILVLLLVASATATGIFDRTPGERIEYVTPRGEQATLYGSGLYRYDPTVVASEGIVWDVVNLAVGVPLLALAVVLSARGSLRGQFLLAGLLFYFFYVYLMISTMSAFNRMFLVYVAVVALALVGFFQAVARIDVAALRERLLNNFPHRLFIGFGLFSGAALVALWLARIVPILRTGAFPPELAGMTTLETQAIDLGLVVPLSLSSAFLLWKRSDWGYLLAGLNVTFGLLMFITIPAWIAVPLIREGRVSSIEAAPFLVLCAVGVLLAIRFYRAIDGSAAGEARRAAPAVRFGAGLMLAALLPVNISAQVARDTTLADTARVPRLAAVVTTATHIPSTTFETPAPVATITRADLRERSPNSAADLFRGLAGLDVNGVGTNQVRPTIRGQRGQRILLLEDGLRMNNVRRQQDFGELPSLAALTDLDRVEVVRGPSSVLYGTDAIGGVVNLITRQAPAAGDSHGHGTASVEYSSASDQRSAAASGAQRFGAFAVRISASARESNAYEAPAGRYGQVDFESPIRVWDSGVRDNSASVLLGYLLRDGEELSFRYTRYDAAKSGFGFVDPATLGENLPAIRIAYPDQEVNRFRLGYSNSRLGGVFADALDVTAYWNRNERVLGMDINIPFGEGAPPGASFSSQSENLTDVQTFGARVEASRQLGAVQFTYGADLFRDLSFNSDSATTTVTGFGPPQTSTSKVPPVPNALLRSVGAFVQSEIRVAEPLTVVLGTRVQEIEARTRPTVGVTTPLMRKRHRTVVGSANVLYRLSDAIVLVASAGRAFRSPNLVERFFDGPVPEVSGYQRAAPELKPETSFNTDIGARYWNGWLSLEAFAFHNTVHDGIRIAPTGETVNRLPVYENVNVDKLRYTGFELQGSARVGTAWQIGASYSRLNSRNVRDPLNAIGASYASKSVGELAYRPTSAVYWAAYTVRRNGRVEDDQIIGSPVGDALPPFTVQGARAGVCVFCGGTYRGTLLFGVENIGDVLYAEPANTSFFRPETGRNFTLGWSIEF